MELSKIGSLVFYIVLFSLSALLLYFGDKRNNKILKFIAVIIPILIGGLRYFVGTDYTNYIDYYFVYGPMSLSDYLNKNGIFEIMFYFIARISYIFTNEYYLFFFATNMIIIVVIYFSIEKIKVNNKYLIWLLFLLLYFPMFLNVIRQGISIVITYYMIALLLNDETKKSFLVSLLSPLFHASGVVTIVLYFILFFAKKRIKESVKNVFVFSVLLLLLIPLASYLLSLTSYLSRFLIYESLYVEGNNYNFYLIFIILMLSLLFYKGIEKKVNNSFFYYLLFAGEVVLTLLGFISPIIKRIALYFSLGQIVILSSFVEIGSNVSSKNILKILIILYVMAYFVLAYYVLGQSNIFPFKTIAF